MAHLVGRTREGRAVVEEIQRDEIPLRLKQCMDDKWMRVAMAEHVQILAAYRGDLGTWWIHPDVLGMN